MTMQILLLPEFQACTRQHCISRTGQFRLNHMTICISIRLLRNTGLRPMRLDLLKKNKFVVTERLSHTTMAASLDEIFHKDLPLFLSTDIILNTLHVSYDNILMDLEAGLLEPNLKEVLGLMRGSFGDIIEKYKDIPGLADPLEDVDLIPDNCIIPC